MPDGHVHSTDTRVADPAPTPSEFTLPTAGLIRFDQLGRTGRARWWRVAAALPVMLLCYGLLLGLIYAIASAASGAFGLETVLMAHFSVVETIGRVEDWSAVDVGAAAAVFATLMIPIALALPATALAVWWLHRRPFRTLLTARPRVDFRAVGVSFLAIVTIGLAAEGVECLVGPGRCRIVVDAGRYLLFLPLVLVLLPCQVLAEEVFFRGFLLQAVGRMFRHRAVIVAGPALIFAAVHLGNPEATRGGASAVAFYLVTAFYLTWLVVKGNGLEYAFGAHLGINFLVFSVIGSPMSPYPSPTIFYIDRGDYGPLFPIVILVLAATHYWFLFHRRGRRVADQ